MPLICFAIAGVAVTLIAEWLGRLRVRSFSISRRSKTLAAWRRAQAYGIFFMPGVLVFWFIVLLLAGGKSFINDCLSWTRLTWLFGVAVFIAAVCWMRLILFFLLAKHWQEAERIMTSRGPKVN